MLVVCLVIVSILALLALAAFFAVVSRYLTVVAAGTPRERLLERDIHRLQSALAEAHAQLLHVTEKPWVLPPVETQAVALEERIREDRDHDEGDEDEYEHRVLSHDELADDLLLEPEVVSL